jgi:gluconate 2-dehydrogenase gamma chain
MTRRLMDRRQLLLGAGPAAATLAVAGLAGGAGAAEAIPAGSYAPTFFSSVEWSFIKAAVGRLIPSDGAGPGGIEVGIPEFIDRQMELPYGYGAYFYLSGPFLSGLPPELGYQLRHTPRELYRLGIAEANAAARQQQGEVFAELAVADQDHFLGMMEKEEVQFPSVPASAVFAQLLSNTKEGYFADSLYGGNRGMAAWKWIGFPGARADFTDWLDQAGRAYPYGPVSISGARG